MDLDWSVDIKVNLRLLYDDSKCLAYPFLATFTFKFRVGNTSLVELSILNSFVSLNEINQIGIQHNFYTKVILIR